MSITGPAQCMLRTAFSIFPVTYTGLCELHKSTTDVKTVFSIFPGTYTGLCGLHKTTTEVKTASSIVPAHKEAYTSFTGPALR